MGHPVKHLKAAQEIMLGTTSPSGKRHDTKLWIVVVEGEPYLRSMNGPDARWFRELTREGDGELVLIDDEHRPRLSVHAEPVADPATLAQVSKAIKKKYGWTHPQYLPRFLDDESVAATLRLDLQGAWQTA
jgi:hypothetical protein